MASTNSGFKLPARPAPGLPPSRRAPQSKFETNDWPPDPFSPPRLKTDPSKEKKRAPPRPPPPRVNNQSSNHFRSIFGSTKRNPKKGAATAIVKPLPPSTTPIIPTGTLIDLQTPPGSPKSRKIHNVDSIWSISSSTKTGSTIESGFEDDFESLLSSGTTTPSTDLLSDFSPDKSDPFEVQPFKSVVSAVTSRPTIICVQKAKPVRPPPPQLDGSPPMPNMPPPPPPPDLLQVLTQGPPLPPRPSLPYKPKDNAGLPTCTAIYDYDSSHPDDLQFKAGDAIQITGEEGPEWLRGRLNGREGIFPATYVAVEKLKKPLMTVIALFPYHPASWDDLELEEGDEIKVLDRVNKDWLYGEFMGRRGIFPECYVQDISYLSDED